MTRLPRLLLRTSLLVFLLLALAALAAVLAIRASLAPLDGNLALPGLSAPVNVERDALGTVTIHAANATDAARALGYVHGQERFFEMDLLRRTAAGELSELFGTVALERDRNARVHRLRARVDANLTAVAGAQMPVLQAYSAGVNAGLHALKARPWPYLLLRAQPRDWTPTDTALAGYAMFFDLQDEANSRELALWRIRQVVPPALYALIAHDGSEWDAPLAGASRGNAALPSTDVLDLRTLPVPASESGHKLSEPAAPGSNNFAVDGALTADGRAIVADDMHLTLRAPNIWFRARLQYADAAAPEGHVDVAGFTLPGVPAVIVGSNRHVAWGFTNSYGDWADFHEVDWADAAHSRYRVPGGSEPVRVAHEQIAIRGRTPEDFVVRETRWGPITAAVSPQRELALQWTAHDPGSLTLGLAELATASNVEQAMAGAGGIGMPVQNLMIADRAGHIGWRLTGRMPLRTGNCDMSAPEPAESGCGWTQWRDGADNPRIVDPPTHRLWTANARTLDGAALAMVGDAGYANGARARQIRDDLNAKARFDERALMAVQLDDRALFLQRWWQLLRQQAQAQAAKDPAWTQIEAATRTWTGRASPDAVSYRIVRAWRLAVLDRLQHGLMAPAMAALGRDFVMPDLPQFEGVAWPLVTQRPMNLLPRRFDSYDALFLDAARDVGSDLGKQGPLAQRTWGERNTARICHPLAAALPAPARGWLCMPAEPLAGDSNMPRVVAPDFGASERMVVAPGHEEDGLVHMPGGQSGNPLSPYWGAGHEAWVRGTPTPFLPGPATHTLTLRP